MDTVFVQLTNRERVFVSFPKRLPKGTGIGCLVVCPKVNHLGLIVKRWLSQKETQGMVFAADPLFNYFTWLWGGRRPGEEIEAPC